MADFYSRFYLLGRYNVAGDCMVYYERVAYRGILELIMKTTRRQVCTDQGREKGSDSMKAG